MSESLWSAEAVVSPHDPADVEAEISRRLARLTLAQKVRLLTGADTWALHPEPAIGLRRLVMSDGPSGVRGEAWDERQPSLNLPSATALAASWDPDLAYRYAAAIAAEAHRKGAHVVLGPTINLHRSPLGGRHFEAYSEDPELTATIGEAYVRGLQDHGVAACPKHYVANDFETERFTASVDVSDRALRELYLAPFERAVAAGAWTVMSAYNAIGGVTMTEHPLLAEPLKGEWEFDGVVVSDWGAVRSVVPAARAAQDVAMPGPAGPWPEGLLDAVAWGDVPPSAIDDKVRRILRLAARVGVLDGVAALAAGTPAGPGGRIGTSSGVVGPDATGVRLAREVAARGTVLVRNEGVLPLDRPATVAVIGQSALVARTQGGGSATVLPDRTVSPLEGLRAAFPSAVVTHTLGAVVHEGLFPLDRADVRDPVTGEAGVRVVFTADDGAVLLDEHRLATDLVWLGDAPAGAAQLELVTDLTPTSAGPVELGVQGVGAVRMEVDGAALVEAELVTATDDVGAVLLSPQHAAARVDLDADRPYRVRVVNRLVHSDAPLRIVALTLGSRPVPEAADVLIADAVEAARAAEVAVVVVGTNAQVESEGFDRTSLALPGHQDALVHAVAAANPRTVVVVNSGAPVLMPWRHEVAAIVLAWFGGQEAGTALADVLSGAVEPGGRLPTTWPGTELDVPVLGTRPVDGVLRYEEGVFVGYRAWQRLDRVPAYPFGFGLGYTMWEHGDVTVEDADTGGVVVGVDVTNVGDRAGREVVQVYLSRPESAVERPLRWLAGSAVVDVEPGARARVEVPVRLRAFQHWDEADRAWALEPGEFTVVVARHSAADGIAVPVLR